MRIALFAFLLLVSCASSTAQIELHRGKLASNEEVGEPLELKAERNAKRTRHAFVYVEVTLENTGSEFVTLQAREVLPAEGNAPVSLVAGKELAAWIENEINLDASSSRSSVGFTIGGFGFGGGGVGMGAGVGVSTGGNRTAPADASAAREAMLRGGGYPNDHLFAGDITVAPNATIKRWFLLQLPSDKVAKKDQTVVLDVAVLARSGDRNRRYVLEF